MQILGEATLLRVYIGEDDAYREQILYEVIIQKAKEQDLAGATVLRGLSGYGPTSRGPDIVVRMAEDRPIIVEIIDSQEKISNFLPVLETVIGSGVVTVDTVKVLRYGGKLRG